MLHEKAEHMDAPGRCSSTRKNLLHRGGRPHMASDSRILHTYLGAGAIHPITSRPNGTGETFSGTIFRSDAKINEPSGGETARQAVQ